MVTATRVDRAKKEERAVDAIKLPDTNFMVVNGQIFLLDKVGPSKDQLVEDIKEFYEAECLAFKDGLVADDYDKWREDWQAQLNMYSERAQRSSSGTMVPNTMDRLPIMVNNGSYAPMLFVRYKPSIFRSTLGVMQSHVRGTESGNYGGPTVNTKLKAAIARRTGGSLSVEVHINQDLIDHMMGVALMGDRIIVARPGRTYHTFEDGKLCTGGTPAAEFFGAPDFERNFNTVNIYSPASHTITGVIRNGAPLQVPYYELLKDQYITDIKVEESSKWSTSKAS